MRLFHEPIAHLVPFVYYPHPLLKLLTQCDIIEFQNSFDSRDVASVLDPFLSESSNSWVPFLANYFSIGF